MSHMLSLVASTATSIAALPAAPAAIAHDLWHPGVPIVEKVVRTLAIYAFLIAGLRLAGKRELGQLNPFDLVVLLLLANEVQNAVIGPDDSLVGGMVGAATLVSVNYLVVRYVFKHPRLGCYLAGDPVPLIDKGAVLAENLERNFISPAELAAAARRQGIERLDEVQACRLETGGALTFIPKMPTTDETRHKETLARLDAIEQQLRRLSGGTTPVP
jgi:uncharacterized membrane protein YcaP (DUF421 family)